MTTVVLEEEGVLLVEDEIGELLVLLMALVSVVVSISVVVSVSLMMRVLYFFLLVLCFSSLMVMVMKLVTIDRGAWTVVVAIWLSAKLTMVVVTPFSGICSWLSSPGKSPFNPWSSPSDASPSPSCSYSLEESPSPQSCPAGIFPWPPWTKSSPTLLFAGVK